MATVDSKYVCELCKKGFTQKIDFTRHKNKKAPCISLDEMQKLTETKTLNTDMKTTLINVFKNCLNILRDNEALVGVKAIRNVSYLLVLKLIEPHLGNEIAIDTYDYNFNHIIDSLVEGHKTKLLSIVRFSNLAKEPEPNMPNIKCLWDDILSVHPATKNIFLPGKGFDITHNSTYKKIIDKLNTLDLSNTDYDILGNAYEEVIQDIMTGKVFGQFFTQPLIKKMMVKLIDPQIHPDGKIDTCCDPTMGTGGFLITYLQHILKQAKLKTINPDWDFIKNGGLYGKELEPETYQLAVANMLIASGHMFEHLGHGDSIREPIPYKFDNILANPPFGIKGLKYDDFQSPLKLEYTPIRTDNAVSLFIQAIIYMLKINGKCAVVLPDGQDLFSKTNKTLVAIREYLIKTCDLKEVIYLPSGIFTYTSIKTCVFYFIKKKEGTDVLKATPRITKTQKITGHDYEFSKTYQTHTVKFYDYNPYEDIKNLMVEVPIEQIVKNAYSLNYAEYMAKAEPDAGLRDTSVVIKTIGELFDMQKGTLQSSKNIEGDYTFITASDMNKTHNSYTHECECVMLVGGAEGSLAKAHHFKGKFIASDLLYILTSKTPNTVNYKYIWYYLNFNRDRHLADTTICCGTPKKMISGDRCLNIKISIPTLEDQQRIVKYLDFIYETCNKTSTKKIDELKQANEFCLKNQIDNGKNIVKTLGEVCNFQNGKGIKKDVLIEGEYPVIGGGQKPLGLHNEYNTSENVILCSSSGAYSGFISKYKSKVWASDCFTIIPKSNTLHNTYLYYLLKLLQSEIYKLQTGTAQPHVYSKDLENIKIPIPSLKRQKEIVDYCEHNDALIKQLEQDIETNIKQAKLFMMRIVNPDADESVADAGHQNIVPGQFDDAEEPK